SQMVPMSRGSRPIRRGAISLLMRVTIPAYSPELPAAFLPSPQPMMPVSVSMRMSAASKVLIWPKSLLCWRFSSIGIRTHVASTCVMRMMFAPGPRRLLDQWQDGVGRLLDEHGVELLAQQARAVILDEFELLGRDIDRVLLDRVRIF